MSTISKVAAAATATAACYAASVTLFAQPSAPAAPHVAPQRALQGVAEVSAVPSPSSGVASVACVGAAVLAAAGAAESRGRGKKVARSFFGGGSSSYAAFDPAAQLGVQEPLGFWDPLGFTKDNIEANFMRRRSVEIKHGRVCMAAAMGYITPQYYKFPGFLSPSLGVKFSDVPNGLAAISKVPALGWVQMIFFAGVVEGCFGFDDYKNGTPGEYGWKVLTSSDPAEKTKKLKAELANGRLAMMAVIGMFFQDGLTGSAWGDWALYTGSPLRAFESEFGIQAPAGFWDPAGFCKDGDAVKFARRRQTEIKHGRVAMLAAMGYMTPEITGKWPGYLSPSMGIKFEDVPNGLAALSKVPAAGWGQIIAWMAYCEISVNQKPGTPGAKGELGWQGIPPGPSYNPNDKESKSKKLKSEIANGRLAMMAIIGMFFQDGLTGSAWGDWALYTGSPLRSLKSDPGFNTLPEWDRPKNGFEGLVGDQPPLGLWDPLGFTKDRSVETFKRRREVELKHGRVSMFATIGYIVPEYFKWPGYLSTSLDLKFADVPNGLKALSVMPLAGIAQFFAFIGFLELSYNKSYGEPGNYGKGLFGLGSLGISAGVDDPKKRDKKLRAEISNGRLAMVAIIGMFFQDGLTGSAWGDWALYTASPLR